jgi:hypothetical protein
MTATMQMQVEDEKDKQANFMRSKWSNRFIFAAIVQGLVATLLTAPLVLPWIKPPVSMVVAGGSAGTWFIVGYIMYIVVGVVAVAVTALFYYYFEVILNRPYKGIANYLAWTHLILMNVGVAAAAAILMYGGYMGGTAMLPTTVGGLGQNAGWVHVNVLGPLVNPAGYAIIAAMAGVLAGGAGFVLTNFRKRVQ